MKWCWCWCWCCWRCCWCWWWWWWWWWRWSCISTKVQPGDIVQVMKGKDAGKAQNQGADVGKSCRGWVEVSRWFATIATFEIRKFILIGWVSWAACSRRKCKYVKCWGSQSFCVGSHNCRKHISDLTEQAVRQYGFGILRQVTEVLRVFPKYNKLPGKRGNLRQWWWMWKIVKAAGIAHACSWQNWENWIWIDSLMADHHIMIYNAMMVKSYTQHWPIGSHRHWFGQVCRECCMSSIEEGATLDSFLCRRSARLRILCLGVNYCIKHVRHYLGLHVTND